MRGLQLIVIGILVILAAACSVAPPAPTPGVPSSSRPTPGPTPDSGFARVPRLPGSPEDSMAIDVVAAGDGFVAVGTGTIDRAAVWRSPDGRTWTAVNGGSAFERAVMTGVGITATGRLVAVGRDVHDVEHDRAAAWISDDQGATWRRVDHPSFADAQLIRIAPMRDGLVAVGGTPGADQAATWATTDGETWVRSAPQASLEHAFLWSVWAADERLVAGGWRRSPEPSAAFWTSTDGLTWQPAQAPARAAGYQVRTVHAFAGGWIAGGDLVEGGRGAAWASADGVRWTLVSDDAFEDGTISDLVVDGARAVAVGGTGSDGAAWVTRDGTSWSAAAAMAGAHLVSVTAGSSLVAVGATQRQVPGTGSWVSRAAVWVAAR